MNDDDAQSAILAKEAELDSLHVKLDEVDRRIARAADDTEHLAYLADLRNGVCWEIVHVHEAIVAVLKDWIGPERLAKV